MDFPHISLAQRFERGWSPAIERVALIYVKFDYQRVRFLNLQVQMNQTIRERPSTDSPPVPPIP